MKLIPDAALCWGGARGPAITRDPPFGNPYCANCGGTSCMSCVFREQHDRCDDDCPLCWGVDWLTA